MIEMGKKYRYVEGGPAEILTTKRPSDWCVVSMDQGGELWYHDLNGVGPVASRRSLVEVSTLDDFNDGDPVMVMDYGDLQWKRRYFAYAKNGDARVYTAGTTNWTSEGKTTRWDCCRRPTPEELGE